MTRPRPSGPYRVGLTGGIGSGKSAVAARFAALGAAVVDTDLISRTLTGPGGQAMAEIQRRFGPDFLLPDGGLDRRRMRAEIFSRPPSRTALEEILHPMIQAAALRQSVAAAAPYVILVVPLLVETGTYMDLVDRVLVVDCAPALQLARTIRRDGIPEAEAQAIIASQADRGGRLAVADDVLDNSGGLEEMEDQVHRLHARYLRLAQNISSPVAMSEDITAQSRPSSG